MPITLLSTQVPAPTKADLYKTMAGGIANTAKAFAVGESATVVGKMNANAVQNDLAFRYGGGSNAICYGLTLSVAAGLNVTVSAGHAIAGTIVEKTADTTVPVPANATHAFIWMDNSGTFQTSSSLTAPGNNCVLIGSVTTTATASVSIDTSGVCYLRNGAMVRETADANAPADTPPSGMIFFTKTLGGEYLWDGSRYLCLIPASVIKANGGNAVAFFGGTPVVKTAVANLTDQNAATVAAKVDEIVDALQALGLF